jgi:exopolyphosphatase / guanosine-5'-triphosphate,3'-diphosphate pyrophosphatase
VRVAAIDIGTNTALLLIAEAYGARLCTVVDREIFVRLGEGTDASGVIAESARRRLVDTLTQYASDMRELGVSEVRVTATSAYRDARNSADVAAEIEQRIGLVIEEISGEEEARLTFEGGVREAEFQGEAITLDIGGGSTELTLGSVDSDSVEIKHAVSTPCGAIRLRERFLEAVPASAQNILAAAEFVDAEIGSAAREMRSKSIIGTSGTTIALAVLEYGSVGAGETPVLTRERVDHWLGRVLRLSPEQLIRLNPEVMTGREDVFGMGLLVLSRAMEAIGADELMVSRGGLRHGVARQLLGI